MRRRWLLAVAASCLLGLGVASATSLGTFESPVAEGLAAPIDHCEPSSVSLVDELLGVIPIGPLGSLDPYTIDEVHLTDLDVACGGRFPAVVVVGEDPILGTDVVLAVQEFTGTSLPPSGDVTLTVDDTDPLGQLTLDVATFVTDVRIVFCEPGSSCL